MRLIEWLVVFELLLVAQTFTLVENTVIIPRDIEYINCNTIVKNYSDDLDNMVRCWNSFGVVSVVGHVHSNFISLCGALDIDATAKARWDRHRGD